MLRPKEMAFMINNIQTTKKPIGQEYWIGSLPASFSLAIHSLDSS